MYHSLLADDCAAYGPVRKFKPNMLSCEMLCVLPQHTREQLLLRERR